MLSPALAVGLGAFLLPEADEVTAQLQRPLDEAFDEIEGDWRGVTEAFRTSPAGRALVGFVDARVAAGAAVFPADPLRALRTTPLDAVRVVILGQDPYHGRGQAEGLAFSVPAGVTVPPSLRNLFKELERDLGLRRPASGSLLPWASRGALLLNTVLTVEEGQPGSHAKQGWEVLTDMVIDAVAQQDGPIAFLLWGTSAQAKLARIQSAGRGHGHRVWACNHPSPLSAARPPRPFAGCAHFGAAAEFLAAMGQPFDWSLGDGAAGRAVPDAVVRPEGLVI